jgi:hypothetical protein
MLYGHDGAATRLQAMKRGRESPGYWKPSNDRKPETNDFMRKYGATVGFMKSKRGYGMK